MVSPVRVTGRHYKAWMSGAWTGTCYGTGGHGRAVAGFLGIKSSMSDL